MACLDCAQACQRRADSGRGHPGFAGRHQACRECFDAGVFRPADLRDDPRRAAASGLAGAIACEHRADWCEDRPGGPFRRCAEACPSCAELCREIAAGAASRRVTEFSFALDGASWPAIDMRGRGMFGEWPGPPAPPAGARAECPPSAPASPDR
jgi:hypothetical protein